MLLPVIMAGGSGSRLWPLSRTLYPKQFLSLTKNATMLQETVNRLQGLAHQPSIFICNEEHRFIVAEQLRKANINNNSIILEPMGKNTAPAITLAALKAIESGEDPLLLVLAADHVIQDTQAFVDAIEVAKQSAENGKLVTFGIIPSRPETGYGYIRSGESICENTFRVDAFVEKPSLDIAQYYCECGDYFWNSGMFLFKASKFIRELENYSPEILRVCRKALDIAEEDLDFFRIPADIFSECPSDSIDYAVMEKTNDAAVVPLDAKWSDVGSWSSLWEVSPKDSEGNVIQGDVLTESTSNSYVYSQSKLVATVGVKDLVVVETKDAVLVAHKDKVQDVKSIVNQLSDNERYEHLQHREVYRPWGTHDEIAAGDRFHVKHVTVKPGEKTATQMHYHRAEHWIVVKGTAKVRNGKNCFLLTENESTYIPIGEPHSIENPGQIPLELIEVRSGAYLSEDDVVRIENYGVGY
ncbi:mannose-1-phosphate guanylyltransferase/mannose-6-phosphate isomerase [Grimontia hollisae]|uniref:mannose-1-phosphate guanylyltransferase/mannose-6-phosphate isomerase n=1 Tax=Grimontia hollisae TaxID=673 RepID=UPI0013030106|nr:mannose-1-phosphate guanylyltransferase/mannose-6-phosphate isomerase [Grimontia hollisae]MDF2184136.1 mannose-1-phosphate guanylyltransferase/mannose-6-phosphate isomerase [Grimontia hollisae]